jgi:O-antigen/teichoic acid export membrane protein
MADSGENMSGIKKRLTKNFGANLYAQFVSVAYQLLTVPLFLFFWPKELYGEWLVISALPSYIALSNMGLMSVAHNNMTMEMGRNDLVAARESLHTVWGAQLVINIFVGLLLWIILTFVDLSISFKLSNISAYEAKLVFLILSLFAMLNLQAGVFGGIYRAVGQNARGVIVVNTIRLFSVITMAVGLWAGATNVVDIAGLLLLSFMVGGCYLFIDTRNRAPELRPGLRYFKASRLKDDVRHGLGFMAYPLGRVITNQGMLLFVNAFIGSSAVVVLATLRTLVNIAFQISNLISLSTWPEFSKLYASKDRDGVTKLFKFSTAIGIWGGSCCAVILLMIGPALLNLWTMGEVVVERYLLFIFLISIIFNSCWYTASTVFNAINKHNKIARIFLANSVLVLIVTWTVEVIFNLGLYSIGLGFFIMEVSMVGFVLPAALKFSGLSFTNWSIGVITFPWKFKIVKN